MACLLVWGVSSLSATGHQTVEYNWGGSPVYMTRVADNFIILYDRSESMGSQFLDTSMTKLQAERKILREKNATLPDMNWKAGIYSFTPGYGIENLTVFYPMQTYDKNNFHRTIDKMPAEPLGATLLQQGLNELHQILPSLEGRTTIFIFTDAQYTPVDKFKAPSAIAADLAARYEVCFGVLDAGAANKGLKQLQKISNVNDCSFMVSFADLLGNPEWMTGALFDISEQAPTDGKEVKMGQEWENILFDFDKYEVKSQYFPIIAKVAEFMRSNPKARIVLAGHTDNVGTRDYNMKLSHRRASAVRDYLVTKEGIDPGRITLNGFGFDDPISSNYTAEGRAQNRRVQGILIEY
jgi:OOP family OmpA-OmpF porin